MQPRALAPLLALAIPLSAIACGSNVAVDGLFGSSSTAGGGGAATTAGSGGAAGSTSAITTGSTASTGSTGTGTATGTGSTGTGTTTGTGSVTGAGGCDPGTVCDSCGDPCTGCLSTSCPATYCGCYENPSCLDLLTCARDCAGDKDCVQACYAADQDGISAAVLLSDCAGQTCQGACQWGAPIEPCQSCLATDCSGEYNACIGDAECVGLYQCLTGCPGGDLGCQQACYGDWGDGVPALQALLDCSKATCAGVCN